MEEKNTKIVWLLITVLVLTISLSVWAIKIFNDKDNLISSLNEKINNLGGDKLNLSKQVVELQTQIYEKDYIIDSLNQNVSNALNQIPSFVQIAQQVSSEHEWNYKGKSEYYVTCPCCYNKLNIRKLKGGKRQDDKKESDKC